MKGKQNYSDSWPSIPYKIVTEGLIEFRVSDSESIYDSPAFFNPVMVLNRDLSILFVRVYSKRKGKPIRVFEPLAGIGIRAMRMGSEADQSISEIVINDFNEVTTKIAAYNISKLELTEKITLFKREARALAFDLVENFMRYHYIDLDPFGSPAPFIDSVWTTLTLNAMISVTATDMTALCGVYPNACLRKYGATPLNNYHTHETAARILIASISKSAARHEIGIKPIFTASVDHYTKVFFEVRKGRGEANVSVNQIGFSYTCTNCFDIKYIQGRINEKIECCGEIKMAGPLWVGDIFDSNWCKEARIILQEEEKNDIADPSKSKFPSTKKILKMLDEGIHSSGLPGYFAVDEISRKLKTMQPKFKLIAEELEKLSYRCVNTHFTKQAFRSDASGEIVVETIKKLVENDNKLQ